MPVDRELFAREYRDFPHFLCPTCKRGRLSRLPNSFQQHKPKAWNSDADERHGVSFHRYTAFAFCSDRKCREVVSELGSYVDLGDVDENGSYTMKGPEGFEPAPPMILVTARAPGTVRAALDKAFALYWVDVDAAASKVRSSLEFLLDDFIVPRNKPDIEGGGFIPLVKRIPMLNHPRVQQDWLDILRRVGNAGTHATLELADFFDMLDIYEDVINKIYDDSSDRTTKLTEGLSKKHR